MKKLIGMILIVLLGLCVSVSYASERLVELQRTGFSSNGAKIAGWHWLRKAGDYAEWTFRLPQGPKRSAVAVLCFSTLSTDTYNGGAGFDSKLKVQTSLGGRMKVKLKNDCPCLRRGSSGDSHGIGYQSHGCAKRKFVIGGPMAGNVLKIRAEYPGGHHTAVKESSLKVILMIKERSRRR